MGLQCGFKGHKVGLNMQHRHLNHQQFTLAVIDDIISRGKWHDWRDLRQAALNDRDVMERIARICRQYAADSHRQRHRFWDAYVETHG